MKALMLHSEDSAVGLYRIWTPAKYLERAGWEITRIPDSPVAIPNDRGYAGENKQLLKAAKEIGSWEELAEGSDIIVMQRPDKPESIALAMALREQYDCPLVFEVDDNFYDVAKTSSQYKYWAPGSPLIEVAELLMHQADAITVSTPGLVEVYKHLNPNIYVLPNYQDPEMWQGIERKQEDDIIIGWAGSGTHYDDVYLIRNVIKKILRNHKNVKFRMLGFRPDFFKGVDRVELLTSWAPVRKFPEKLAKLGFDIGVVPVVQRPFNEAKSNIKWQEYSMLGIPTVASRVGEYGAIESGVTGFLASTEGEWYAHLDRLVRDAELRKTVGEQAKQEVLASLTIQSNIGKWNDTYNRIIGDYQSVSRASAETT